ncbi:MAG: ROK family protein [Phycisphaerales bacterium]|nr:ROK family protein [Phycisphaerales bacterium]
MLLGIDVGGSSVKVAVLDGVEPGSSLGRTSPPHRTARVAYAGTPDAAEIRRAVGAACAQVLGAAPGAPRAVGLCLPGVVDPTSRVVRAAANLPGLVGVRVDDLLPREMMGSWNARASLHTDAYAAAVGHRMCAPPLGGRLAAISIGTGVGLSVIDAFDALRVSGESSGHLGQVDVGPCAPGGAVARDGARDTLEAYAGLPALRARFGSSIEHALAAMRADDPACVAIVRGVRIVHAIYRPQRIALLGGVGRRLAHLREELFEAISRDLTSLAREDWTLEFGDSDALAAIGCAWLAGRVADML